MIKSATLNYLITTLCLSIDNPSGNLFFAFHPEQAPRCQIVFSAVSNSLDPYFVNFEKTTENFVIDTTKTYVPTELQDPLFYTIQVSRMVNEKRLSVNNQNFGIIILPDSLRFTIKYEFR